MIFAFQGSEHKVGVTMVAQSFTEALAKKEPSERMLLLLFGTNKGRNYIKDDLGMVYISKYIPKLIEDKFTIDDIYDGCWNEGNVFIFGGVDRRYNLHEFYPDMAEKIIKAARDNFRHIVIDTGSTLDYGLSMPGILNIADAYYYVLTQNESAINEMVDIKTYFKKYNLAPKAFMVNKFDENDIYTQKYIASRLGVSEDKIMKLPEIDKSKKAEIDKTTFVKSKDRIFTKAINSIIDTILKKGG